jgi:large subunit ribosomal protein L35
VPKNKTHSGAKKRFKVTGTGRVQREQANRQHLFESKSSSRTRRLSMNKDLSPADVKKARRLLGL